MNITELRYLVAIMKWGSVSAAAKQMYAAQPNVSKALKNLEEEYGIRMFERSSTGMIPTEQGRHFIEQAQRVLQEVDREQIMEFEYRLLVNRDSPLARHEVHDLAELNRYTEVLHDDFQLPGEEGSSLRWQVNENRRVHVYERCSQFSILQSLPTAYMWASPMPQRALEQYHLVLKKCPAQNQRMRDVLVYPDKGGLRPEEEKFIELLRRQAALTVK